MYPESDDLNNYLLCDGIVDWKTPAVLQKAQQLTNGLTDEIDMARCLYEWVRDQISHSADAGVDVVTCSASEVLQHGTGICYSKSHLLAALLRAVNIPAGFCYQVLCMSPPMDDEYVLHGLNAVYLASLGRWIRLDARGNRVGVNAQFGIRSEQLAFAMDEGADEFIYETIFADPVERVVSRLRKYKRLKDLLQDLPDCL